MAILLGVSAICRSKLMMSWMLISVDSTVFHLMILAMFLVRNPSFSGVRCLLILMGEADCSGDDERCEHDCFPSAC